MTDITPETVARMLRGVTPGPWDAEGPEHSVIIWGYADRDDREYRVCFMTSDGPAEANARFIAWAREAVPALSARLAEVEATLKLALPHLEENARWHRDAQSHAQKCEAAFAIVAAARAAPQGETK